MPHQIALILCIILVFFLLRNDHRQTADLSWTLWIPTIWMLLVSSKPLAVWFPMLGRGAEVDSSPLDQIALILLLISGLIVLIRRKINWLLVIKNNFWLILLLTYLFLSIFWSDIPFVSFKRWIRELVAVIMALVVLTEYDPRRAFQSLIRRSIFILIPFSLLLIKYYPELGRMYGRWTGEVMWIGVTTQKNGLGRLSMISCFFLIWTLVRRWKGRDSAVMWYQTLIEIVVLLITLILLVGPTLQAYSATAVTALITGLMIFSLLLWMVANRLNPSSIPFAVFLALIIILGTATVFLGGETVADFTGTLGRDATLTGRTGLWANLLPVAMQRGILGHGFGGFWTSTTRTNYETPEAHSGYLDVLLDTGIFGLLLSSLFLLSSCRRAQRSLLYDFYWSSLWICFLFMTVIHNITETSLTSFTTQLTAILLFLAVNSSESPYFRNKFQLYA